MTADTHINEFMFTTDDSDLNIGEAHYIAVLKAEFIMPANSSATLTMEVYLSNCVDCSTFPE